MPLRKISAGFTDVGSVAETAANGLTRAIARVNMYRASMPEMFSARTEDEVYQIPCGAAIHERRREKNDLYQKC